MERFRLKVGAGAVVGIGFRVQASWSWSWSWAWAEMVELGWRRVWRNAYEVEVEVGDSLDLGRE